MLPPPHEYTRRFNHPVGNIKGLTINFGQAVLCLQFLPHPLPFSSAFLLCLFVQNNALLFIHPRINLTKVNILYSSFFELRRKQFKEIVHEILCKYWILHADKQSAIAIGSVAGSRLEGFTVRNGRLSGIEGFGSVTITNNVVNNNTSIEGGGIFTYSTACYWGDTTAFITDNTVTGNTSVWDPTPIPNGDSEGRGN